MGSMTRLPMVAELVEEALKVWSNNSSGESAEVCAADDAFTLLPMFWVIVTDFVSAGRKKRMPTIAEI